MPTHEIEVSNLGPVEKLSFQLKDYGVTCLVAANGRGKSILLDAVQKAAMGNGKLPLRDGQRRGSLNMCGAVISIGASTRHNGEFQVDTLEGKFSLAELVDPGMKTAETSDKQRIKALVSLMGVPASRELFASHPSLTDLPAVVSEESTATTDIVEMAGKIKRDYDRAALEAEREADREEAHARGMEEAAAGVDLEAESNADRLQSNYDAARDAHAKLGAQITGYDRLRSDATSAKAAVRKLQDDYKGESVDAAQKALDAANSEAKRAQEVIDILAEQLEVARRRHESDVVACMSAQRELQRATEHRESLKAHNATIARFTEAGEVTGDLAETDAALVAAAEAMAVGVKIRMAKEKLTEATKHKEAAAAARTKAKRLREAAGCVDEVLSDAIKCDRLKVELREGVPRLVTDHPVRGETDYHQLSEGERWTLAIDLGVERVGEGGLLVVEQGAWESCDSFNRAIIHEHAKLRKVFLLTAEATRDPADGKEMQAKPFEPAGATT
jgi:hypothetical protein